MSRRSGRFRVYRVVESVLHLNFYDVDERRLYSVFQTGYGDRQDAVDDLSTGALVEATLSGDPDDDTEPWRLAEFDRVGGVTVDFATGVDDLPAPAVDLWEQEGRAAGCPLVAEETPVGEAWVHPRDRLPDGAFVDNVLAGAVPLDPWLEDPEFVPARPAEVIVVDPDDPGADRYTSPYGVLLLFTEAGEEMADEYRDAYGLSRDADTRPSFDPY